MQSILGARARWRPYFATSTFPTALGSIKQLWSVSCSSPLSGELAHQHHSRRRPVHIFNLDPAAEQFKYPVQADIRDLISLDDVQEELKLGPNGGLVFCMEYLEDNLEDWLGETLEGYG